MGTDGPLGSAEIVATPQSESPKNLRHLSRASHILFVADSRSTLGSFGQLVQELIDGSVRRHTFTQPELELLLDLQNSNLRKSSKPDVLRRYLRAAQIQFAKHESVLRFSKFMERENAPKSTPPPPGLQSPAVPAPLG